ncbi:MAG: DUF5320 domain-containing protein [Bacteroidetes bacterium]|nr:DUF5320 domain-containing protein [Bacteroidota bacterium]MBU1578176.1 DUF5320 domain-containing protein [Bacteroidota bacterium]MBU2466809.1 DUF5320 domain-containing protein [Bacteroidota bacterium]
MPGFDQTGPQGKGPQTGGQRGLCASGRATAKGRRGFGQMATKEEKISETGEDWRPNHGFGGGRAAGFGGGRRRRFRNGQ